ncbi:MAG TPA: hypothetical protein ENK18_24720 [Deltaproteobacteria bacterium]|nr:hypothetical protein [Deltaproteobacteria bacterium]
MITGTDISPTLFLEGDDDALYGKTVSTLKGKKSEERAIKGRFNRASRELSFEEVNGPYTYRAILDESLCTGDGMVSDGGFRTRVIGMSRRSPTCRPQR